MARIKVENYFAQSHDKFVKGVTVYAKSADNILYYESDYKTKVKKNELIDLFKKGELIVNIGDDVLTRPYMLGTETGYSYVALVVVSGGTGSALTYMYGSEGYTAG